MHCFSADRSGCHLRVGRSSGETFQRFKTEETTSPKERFTLSARIDPYHGVVSWWSLVPDKLILSGDNSLVILEKRKRKGLFFD
jgi:hypothetical protein